MCSHVNYNDKSLNDQMKNVASGSSAPAMVAIGAPSGSEKSCFNTRFVYNSKVKPALVEANLARKMTKNSQSYVKGRVVWASGSNGNNAVADDNVTDKDSQIPSDIHATFQVWQFCISPGHCSWFQKLDHSTSRNGQYCAGHEAVCKPLKILIRCDNQAVVTVLRSGKTRDAFLAASARNIWYVTAIHDIEVQYTHISGARNQVADTLSRWQGSVAQIKFL